MSVSSWRPARHRAAAMFRHQTHPYQTTVVPRTDHQFHQSAQQRAKYPWIDNPPHECQSTNSSNEDTYQIGHYTNPQTHWTTRSHSDGLSSPVYHTPYSENPRLSPPTLSEYAKPYQTIDITKYNTNVVPQESEGSIREHDPGMIPQTRSPVPSEIRAPGGCGGHCPGFEYVCYYVLQIIFIIGILTGISLCIAGSVLRRSNRSGDLGVLIYIGCLSLMVCSLLLGVQCCVKQSNKQRSKQLRLRTAHPDCIPLDTIPQVYIRDNSGVTSSQNTRHLQPLLLPIPHTATSTLPRNYRLQQNHPAQTSSEEINGIPWWRRQ